MDDLISRQAAIDALNAEIKIVELTNAIAVQDYIRDVYRKLCALPSAQPEIIRCNDCKWSETVSGYLLCGAWEAKAVDKDGFCSDAERRTDE